MIALGRRLVEDLGLVHQLLETDVFAGYVELLLGDAVAAEERLRPAYEALRSHGLGIDAARAAALLGLALLALGRGDDAEASSHECEELAGDDLKAAIAWRRVRAEALARRGAHADAVALAQTAVDIAASTDALLDHADARVSLAGALQACGRDAEAAVELSRAIQLWEAKGAALLAEHARSETGSPAPLEGARGPASGAWSDAGGGRPPRFANLASRATERFFARWEARDWDGLVGMFAEGARMIDRRALVGIDLAGDALPAGFRVIFEMGFTRWRGTLMATRGHRLALFRTRSETESVERESGEAVAAVVEYLGLNEVDAAGRITRFVVFDVDDVEAAYVELENRWLTGDGAAHADLIANDRAFRRASAARDWDAVALLLPDDYTLINHRRFGGTGARLTRDEYVEWRRSTDDLRVHADMRVDHVLRISAHAGMHVATSFGTIDEGPFELPFVSVFTHDGRAFHSSELFDLDRLDEALARYEELAFGTPGETAQRPGATTVFANAATRTLDRFVAAWDARDWEGVAATLAPGFHVEDRRALMQLRYDRAAFLESLQPFWGVVASRFRARVLATRGQRFMLSRGGFVGTDGLAGPSEVEFFAVSEVDENGERVAMVMFDATDVDAAYAELDARYEAGGAAVHPHTALARAFRTTFANRDWEAFVEVLSPDVTVSDHRLLGWETLRGPAAYTGALRSLVELAPDVRLRIDHVLALSERAALYATSWVGTREGGAFEEPSVIVAEFDGRGRFHRFDQFEVGQLGEAWARYAAAVGEPGPQPSRATSPRR
jgi:tetratricopeptide (TPR) repeat protein